MPDFLPDADLIALVALLVHALLALTAAVMVSTNRRPSAAIAWVLAIVFIPFLGALAFFLVGTGKLPQGRRDKQRIIDSQTVGATADPSGPGLRADSPAWLPSVAALNRKLGALPLVGGNRVTILAEYSGTLASMVEEIDQATDYVHVEFYILARDETTKPFFAALQRATARGVTVRVLSDHLAGLMGKSLNDTRDYLAEIGAEWHAMLPLRPLRGEWQRPDLRNHRKILVVDGRVAFTGSQNVIDASYNKPANIKRGLRWHDLMIRVEGPVVRELDAVFAADWYSETDLILPLREPPLVQGSAAEFVDAQVLPSGPTFDYANNLKLYTALVYKAERRVSITSPYFVPDDSILLAMVTAADRGLEVELFVSEIGDQAMVYHAQRSYYEALLRAGVRIYLYPAPKVLHAKHFTIDDDVAVIGSSNMDLRSFILNMEVSVLVHGRELVTAMRRVEDGYRAESRELQLEDWLERPVRQKVFDNLARLTSSLQ
ncbi:cardiolipin synthase [Cellulosimicrobium funkei]|nr:cardiolipin synthase [Cellulosimicrobium funkei]